MAKTAAMSQAIANDEASPNDLKPIYSTNRLKNSDAEAGDLDHWAATGASVVPGGAKESITAFRLNPRVGTMKQQVTSGGTQPADFKVGGYFLPEKVAKAADVNVLAYARVEYLYADGTKDIAIVPVRGAINYGE